ncbi:glutamine--fructose-6-phosphate transaminase (isomerizing) [Niameybacter massiliensis]|uniref:Glutamine--fructose-6-phosphate aminotransferase [isomerizing] n=1 Tax=Holtiella tumoricola TaxID=3018743 RepID=A0AA42IZR8_9FIRM|nr:glutamine--fructose-6-phosphate transaminase (isomerizing) [Holtiella tumoricola]MDA3730697.1 glutamine--fructose-6-phosphate transaminase (isomerizing) [Holtiella tumoricola]
MCGIVGFYGKHSAKDIILEGLSALEYRGYDSSGIAVIDEHEDLKCIKEKGRLKVLEETVQESGLDGHIGIGHTRWATHGVPSKENAHPHLNSEGTIAVVHNGIIENYLELKHELIEKGYIFVSDTDTEVVAHLIDLYDEGDFESAVYKTLDRLKGAYALGIISSKYPDTLIATRKESPLVVGVKGNEYVIASDIPALLGFTRDVYYMDNNEVIIAQKGQLRIQDLEGNVVSKTLTHIDWDTEAASKNGYSHFMMKEIYDQPTAIRETLCRRLDEKRHIQLDDIKLQKEDLDELNKIYIVACGTAYHAGLVGKYAIEKLARIPVEVDIASEFRYSDPFVDDKTLLIVVSQSGETADTLAALKEAKRKGARVLAITNVVGSSVAREADDLFYTWAGPEIAVASTKAYTAQLVAFYMLALHFANTKGTITDQEYVAYVDAIEGLGNKVEEILSQKETIEAVAKILVEATSAFYLGRGLDYTTAMEAALKLKEISYLHTEAFAAGELKHGTIALIEEGTPVLAIVTQERLAEKMISNMKEVKARGAYVIAIAKEGTPHIGHVADKIIEVPAVCDILMPILSVIPTQLLAYYTSTLKGLDVDKPRNLAKSVTVE